MKISFTLCTKKTDLPISVIYAFFIIEATNAGIESKLMAKAFNPGGIKYRGSGKKMNALMTATRMVKRYLAPSRLSPLTMPWCKAGQMF